MKTVELCFPHLNTSCRKAMQLQSENIYLFILLTCISFLTVFLNLLVIISISHFRQLHTPANLFLISLAVSDFLVGLLLMPIRIFLTEGCWVLGSFMCGLFNYFSFVLTSASVGNMVLISADRYVAICDPLRYPSIVSQKRVKVCVCLCWACSVSYNGVIVKDFLKSPDKYSSCVGECIFGADLITGVFDLILTFFAPITVIIVLYTRVFMVAVSQARAMRSHIAALRSVQVTAKKSERKAATALGVVVVVFLICFCPYFYPSFTGQDYLLSDTFSVFCVWLLYFNSCVNPIVYALFYPWFRKSVKIVFTHQFLDPDSCDANIL